jgi:hypothetical protein
MSFCEGSMIRDGVKYTARNGVYKQWLDDNTFKELTRDQYLSIKDGNNKNHAARKARHDVREAGGIQATAQEIDIEITRLNLGNTILELGEHKVKVETEGNFRIFAKKMGVLPSKVASGLIHNLAGPMKMDKITITGDDRRISFEAKSPFGGITRVFSVDRNGNLEVEHRKFVNESREDRSGNVHEAPKGMSKQMLKDNFDLYKKIGVKVVRIKTDEDGSVIWAKAGFTPYSADEASSVIPHLQDGLTRRLQRIRQDKKMLEKHGIDEDRLNDIEEIINGLQDRPEDIALLANNETPLENEKSKTLGHLLLYNQGWIGSFKMDSERSNRVLHSYISKRQ